MPIGYDVYESDNNFEKRGITGHVERYVREGMLYPCYIVRSEEDKKVGLHQMTVLKSMFENQGAYMSDDEDNSIYVYYSQGGKLVRVGKIYPKQVKTFLTLFKDNYVDCFLNKDKELVGDYLYVLSS